MHLISNGSNGTELLVRVIQGSAVKSYTLINNIDLYMKVQLKLSTVTGHRCGEGHRHENTKMFANAKDCELVSVIAFINSAGIRLRLENGEIIQSKKISNDQELIQSGPTSCPINQKGNNLIHKSTAVYERHSW